MLKKILTITIIILLLAGAAYYWFFVRGIPDQPRGQAPSIPFLSFNPFKRSTVTPPPTTTTQSTSTTPDTIPVTQEIKLPILRHVSLTPIGGFMASTTASTALVRYIDRGVGHIYEALSTSATITKISNTTIPKIYESTWNRNLTALVLRYLKDDTDTIVNFYAELRPVAMSLSTTSAADYLPYEIKGKFLSPDIRELAVSPKKDRIFTLNLESGRGVGYLSGFDESKKTKIFDTPLTHVSLEWPEDNTLAITTKPSGVSSGFLYLFDIKKAAMTRILGGIAGLSTKVSADAKKVLFSSGKTNTLTTNIFTLKDSSTEDVVFKTLADKCVWSRIHPNEMYCAVPTKIDQALYPDDWYKGKVSFIDQIWHLDTTTGEVHLIANPLTLADALVDATNLTLDPKENFLYFTNKRDLTLWSLDLNQ